MKKIILAFIIGILFAPFALAAEGGIQISPLTYNLDLKPGESQEATVNITNQNAEDLNYVMEVELFSEVTNEGAPSFAGVKKPEGVTTLADWVTFAQGDKEGLIKPGAQKEIKFTISIPAGAEPGGHYAAVFAKQVKKTPGGVTELGIASRVGTLMLVSIPGNVKKTVNLKDFLVSKFIWKGPVPMSAEVENTGSIHYDSQVKVALDPLFGATSEVDLGKHTIIPQNERSYKGAWSKKYPFGYYKFTAQASDGDGNFTSKKTSSAIAIPLIIVLPLLAVIIIVLLVVRYVRKNFKFVKARSNHQD